MPRKLRLRHTKEGAQTATFKVLFEDSMFSALSSQVSFERGCFEAASCEDTSFEAACCESASAEPVLAKTASRKAASVNAAKQHTRAPACAVRFWSSGFQSLVLLCGRSSTPLPPVSRELASECRRPKTFSVNSRPEGPMIESSSGGQR
jgi:hypothetical protein